MYWSSTLKIKLNIIYKKLRTFDSRINILCLDSFTIKFAKKKC